LNSTFGFGIVLAPNYLLMTLIRVSVTWVVTVATTLDQPGAKVIVFEPHSNCADIATRMQTSSAGAHDGNAFAGANDGASATQCGSAMGATTKPTVDTLSCNVVAEDGPDEVACSAAQMSVATVCAPVTAPDVATAARTYATDHAGPMRTQDGCV
jgi:hypothetical protein